uniref:Uncharacterized protein n=1 Tax=Arundo donax TaxID=35708 RepID=A0A0A9K3K4_ARUDO
MFTSDVEENRMARCTSPIFLTPDGCRTRRGYEWVYTRPVSSVDRRIRTLPIFPSLPLDVFSPLFSPSCPLSKTPTVRTVAGS